MFKLFGRMPKWKIIVVNQDFDITLSLLLIHMFLVYSKDINISTFVIWPIESRPVISCPAASKAMETIFLEIMILAYNTRYLAKSWDAFHLFVIQKFFVVQLIFVDKILLDFYWIHFSSGMCLQEPLWIDWSWLIWYFEVGFHVVHSVL